jgi:hypothetical protein
MQDVQAEQAQAMQMQQQMELTKQVGQLASAPANDPSKYPQPNEQQQQPPQPA